MNIIMSSNALRLPALSLAAVAMLTILDSKFSSAAAQTVFVANTAGTTTTAYTILKYDSLGNGVIWVPNNGWSGSTWEVPSGVALDNDGNLYVAYSSSNTNFIKKFDAGGNGTVFAGLSLSFIPGALAFDSHTNLFVINQGNHTIEKFSPNGTDLGGFGDRAMQSPDALAFDSKGNLFVSDVFGTNILKFDTNGHGTVFVSGDYYRGLAFDSNDNLDVGVGWSIEKFDANGASLGTLTLRPGEFASKGLMFDSNGNLFMSDYLHGTICRFDPLGNETTFATAPGAGTSDLEFLVVQSTKPQLGIAPAGGGKTVLSWPATASTWILQSATNLWAGSPSITNWTDSAISPSISDGQCLLTNSFSGEALFFRLRKP
jgi:sugar lactone lactonase YvrE